MPVSREVASARGRMGAHTKWARTADRTAATAAMREGLRKRFAREVDPDGVLTDAERDVRVEHAFRAHMAALSLKAALARQSRKAATQT